MKTILIFLLVAFTSVPNNLYKTEGKERFIISCPSQEPFDWIAVTKVLTSQEIKSNHAKLLNNLDSVTEEEVFQKAIKGKTNEIDSKESWNLQINDIANFWLENGVTWVSDGTICQSISTATVEVLKKNIGFKYRAFYKVNDFFIVILKSEQQRMGLSPVVILDKDFRIVNEFGV